MSVLSFTFILGRGVALQLSNPHKMDSLAVSSSALKEKSFLLVLKKFRGQQAASLWA